MRVHSKHSIISCYKRLIWSSVVIGTLIISVFHFYKYTEMISVYLLIYKLFSISVYLLKFIQKLKTIKVPITSHL